MSDVILRRPKADDFGSVHSLISQVHSLHVKGRPDLYKDADPLQKDEFVNIIGDENIVSVVAEIDGKVVGFCQGYIKTAKNKVMTGKKSMFIDDICVDSSVRKKGVGRLLLNFMKTEGKRLGALSVELMVWSFNQNAVDFYKHMGMTERSLILEEEL